MDKYNYILISFTLSVLFSILEYKSGTNFPFSVHHSTHAY